MSFSEISRNWKTVAQPQTMTQVQAYVVFAFLMNFFKKFESKYYSVLNTCMSFVLNVVVELRLFLKKKEKVHF